MPGETPIQPMTEATKKTLIVVLILAALLLLTIAVVYIAYLVKKSGLKKADLQSKLIALDDKTIIPFKIPNGLMSIVNRGQEYTISLWTYLSPQYEPTTDHKLIFQRGNTSAIAGMYDYNTNPLIFMDKMTNRMYFAVATSAVTQTSQSLTDILSKDGNGRFSSGFLITYIDYLPLQRWVHTCLVVRDNTIMVFMDGDLYSVASVSEIPDTGSGARPILRTSQGDASIGDINTLTKGYVSKTQYFNYGLNQQDLSALYKSGPMKTGWLSWLGINNYAVRSPIYSLDDNDAAA